MNSWDTSRPKILLLGDSFVWGASAKPLTCSFADLVEKAGTYVYNGGIPGTDPMQYAAVAEKYVPKLKPDIVAVCVYLGNDVSGSPMPMIPNKNIHYVSNIGFLRGFDDQGRFFRDGPEALRYFKSRKCGCPSSFWDTFLYKTVVGRGVHGLLYGEKSSMSVRSRNWVTGAMQRIRDVCRANGSEMMVFLIPFARENIQVNKSVRKNLPLFEGFPCYYPESLDREDYCPPPDNHFNNQGHRKYADFILEILERKGYGPNWKR